MDNTTSTYTSANKSIGQEVEEHHQRWYKLLLIINQVLLAACAIAISFWFIIYLITQQYAALMVVFLGAFYFVTSLIGLLLLRNKKRLWRLRLATMLHTSSTLIVIGLLQWVVGTSGAISLLFWTPVAVSIMGLSVSIITATTIITVGVISLSISLQSFVGIKPILDVAKDLPIANIFLWAIGLSTVLIGLFVFKRQLEKSIGETLQGARATEQSNTRLSQINKVGSQISQKASTLSNELTATSNQQALGAAQQSSAVVEATAALEEMGQGALQIAENTALVAKTVKETFEAAKEVKTVTEQAAAIAEQGNYAVEATITGFTRVNKRIELLAQHLLVLTERSRQINNILNLLNGIADETHLLALNAAIESAGAGEYGQRFGIVASEVKSLADRTREAGKEVQDVVNELQGSVAAAVLVAEEGRKDASIAATQASQTGLVLSEVLKVVNHTGQKGAEIVAFATTANRLVEEIRLATRQQQSASDQILTTIRQVKEVSQETATGSRLVATVATQLSELTYELKTTLTRESVVSVK